MSASVMGLPATVLANPHWAQGQPLAGYVPCGLGHPALQQLERFQGRRLQLISPSTTPLVFGTKRSGASRPARGVSYSSKKWSMFADPKRRSATES